MNGVRRMGHHSISGLFAFLLIGLFALFAMTIVVSGIRAYRGMADGARVASQQRLALGYVSGKLRASGDRGSVSIREEQGVKLLVITEQSEGDRYETRIYYANGSLREQFCMPDLPFDPEDGEPIASLPGFSFTRTGDLVNLTARLSGGGETEASVALRAGEGGGPDAL